MTEESGVIYENKYYSVVIGKSSHSDKEVDCYQIINKQYGIVESESSVLPIACTNADDFADGWDEINPDNKTEPSPLVTLN